MKLLCCISLCLATVSAYGLQTDDANGVLNPNKDSSTRGEADDVRRSLFRGASLATLLGSQSIDPEKGEEDGMSYVQAPAPYSPWELKSGALSATHLAAPSSLGPKPRRSCIGTASFLIGLLKDSLYQKGIPDRDVESLLVDVLQRLCSGVAYGPRSGSGVQGYPSKVVPAYTKRGYPGRGSFHMRFAPRFGTKLIPNQKMGDGGSTLLRYGRSAEAVESSKEQH